MRVAARSSRCAAGWRRWMWAGSARWMQDSGSVRTRSLAYLQSTRALELVPVASHLLRAGLASGVEVMVGEARRQVGWVQGISYGGCALAECALCGWES